MNTFKPDRNGYVKNWIVSGVLETEVPKNLEGVKSDQPMPTFLRMIPVKKAIFDDNLKTPEKPAFGQLSNLGMPWKYYQHGTNQFVDFSKFYYSMKKTEYYAACELWSDYDTTITAKVWHHPCIQMWLNDEFIYNGKYLRHFPIYYEDIQLKLRKGKNEIFVRVQGLGVIVLNNMFALQLKNFDGITVKLPGDDKQYEKIIAMDKWLWSVKLQENSLTNNTPPPNDVSITFDNKKTNWAIISERKETDAIWKDHDSFLLNDKYTRVILKAEVEGQTLFRRIEIDKNITPEFHESQNMSQDYLDDYIQKIAQEDNQRFGVLARYLTDTVKQTDDELIETIISNIENRIDCADFDMSALIRLYTKCYDKLSEEQKLRFKKTVLDFKYWVDEPGPLTMAMVTENHSLMFHACQYAAGSIFKNEIFTCSGRSGKAQTNLAIERIQEWFNQKETEGLHEFNSNTYMTVTMGALLLVIDYVDDDSLVRRAAKMLNKIFYYIGIHTFKGVIYAPQGRMYRNGIYPYTTPIQAMLSYVSPASAIAYDSWISTLYCSKYKLPNLDELIKNDIDTVYNSAGAEIKIKKTDGYIMSSIDVNENSEAYKSGKVLDHEHQEHLWFAAIDADCAVFTNHPGVSNDLTVVRPGYWYGNGVLPSVSQNKNIIECCYTIPDYLPIKFVHCYFPMHHFDECDIENHFLFGRKNDSYIAVWCNEKLEPFNDVLQDCEFRAYNENTKWRCFCSTKSESGSFNLFKEEFKHQIK